MEGRATCVGIGIPFAEAAHIYLFSFKEKINRERKRSRYQLSRQIDPYEYHLRFFSVFEFSHAIKTHENSNSATFATTSTNLKNKSIGAAP
jgi:hypothetical protein